MATKDKIYTYTVIYTRNKGKWIYANIPAKDEKMARKAFEEGTKFIISKLYKSPGRQPLTKDEQEIEFKKFEIVTVNKLI